MKTHALKNADKSVFFKTQNVSKPKMEQNWGRYGNTKTYLPQICSNGHHTACSAPNRLTHMQTTVRLKSHYANNMHGELA